MFMTSPSARADLVGLSKQYLMPAVASDMQMNDMVKNTNLCKGFTEQKQVVNWAVNAWVFNTYNAWSALNMTGSVPSCGKYDLYSNRPEAGNTAANLKFVQNEQRYKAAIDLFLTTCFRNGQALQKKMYGAAMNTARNMSCADLEGISGNAADMVRRFNF